MALPQNLKKLSLPVVGAPMFIVSTPELVIAQCKAGVVGSFPALNARPASQLGEWISRIKEELAAHDAAHPDRPSAPFAVNQIVHRSNDRLEADLRTCVDHEVPLMITSLGARKEVYEAAHSYGGLVFHDVINQTFAHKAVDKGADGLILVAAGAGGHAGTISPFALIQETRAWFDGPILLSGAIANGRSILAAQAMGADLAYIGSAFIATQEAHAIQDYKQMIVDSAADDIVYSDVFSGVHGNYLKPSISRAGVDLDNLLNMERNHMDFSKLEGSKAWKDIWGAGQGIGSVKTIASVEDRIKEFKAQYEAAKKDLLENS